MVAAFLTTVLFSLSAVFAHRTAKILGGTEANFWRLLIALMLLGSYSHLLGVGLGGAGFYLFLYSGMVGFGVGDLALFQALPRLGSRLTVLLVHCVAAPFASLVEWQWLGTTLTERQMLAGLAILCGVALALAPGKHLKVPRALLIPGICFGLVAACGQGLGAVISRRAFQVSALNGTRVDGINAAYQRIIGGVVLAGLFLLFVKWQAARQAATSLEPALSSGQKWQRSWYWVLLNALSGPTLGVSCYQWALSTTPTGVVMPIVAMTPLVVIPFSMYMEGETLSKRSLLGGLLAVGGVVALTLSK